ncbi:PREDICTED: uncharacterized protein LOC104704821 isoform X1 [Camelina sativa]|uniref:Uncharacterized protein LOC104704821 isoform X1 n=1 Tax=Camelina sativa TaxID=90675 RepID=A0ABM1Q8G2_CAMSA|nr:PREDICTED: uncharacterized protein LOC104704821 isoform X1 [Camelina sativa]
MFDQVPSLTQDKLNWNDVLEISDHLSKQATIVGMLWIGEQPPQAEALKEAMGSYFNALQGFLLHCHGSMAGAGITLSSSIQASVKQIVDSRFLQGSVSLYEGTYEKGRKPSIPQLAGAVWEACSNLKKVPATNIKAIGRAMTLVAVSMKDVLREMKELKPACSSSEPDDAYTNAESLTPNSVEDEDDLVDNLSPEEFEVAKMVADIVSETLLVIKELIRTITGMIKLENPTDNGGFVDSLEKLLKLCQGTSVHIDELGACVYPPQECGLMKQTGERIKANIGEIEAVAKGFKNFSSEALLGTCRRLQILIEHMETELDTGTKAEVVCKMQNVTL